MKKTRILLLCFLAALCLIPQAGGSPEPKKIVALTFDDGPAGKITEALLEGLRQRNVSATFFLCCYRMEQYPELVEQMAQQGHEIGVHGCSHNYFTQMTEKALLKELQCTKKHIEALTGQRPTLLRPPGGLYNNKILAAAKKEELAVILWDIDPEDWDPGKRGNTIQWVVSRANHGDVILLHDLSMENVKNALDIIDTLQEEGYEFCTVSQLAKMSGTVPEAGKIYTVFP